MSRGIYEINKDFPFPNLTLHKPFLNNGMSLIKFTMNKTGTALTNRPLYVQLPPCKMKTGIVKSGKRHYCDFLFSSNENEIFIEWIENLEKHCQTTVFENKNWFETDFDLEEIESLFLPTIKTFKSGKFYFLRANIPMDLGIFDDTEKHLSFEDVGENMDVMTILEIQGIKCSPRNFQIEMEVKQLLIVKPMVLFGDKCIIIRDRPERLEESPRDSIVEPPRDSIVESPPFIPENKEINVSPLVESPLPVVESPLPVVESPLPVVESPLPVMESPLPVVESPLPVIEKPLNKNPTSLEEVEVELVPETGEEPMKLKSRNDVYYKMYRDAREKAKLAKQIALSAYLEAKRIKNEYMLKETDESDEDEIDDE